MFHPSEWIRRAKVICPLTASRLCSVRQLHAPSRSQRLLSSRSGRSSAGVAEPIDATKNHPEPFRLRGTSRCASRGKSQLYTVVNTFRCQACRTTFTSRRNTALYRLKTPSHQVAMVLAALAEGLDPSEASRVFGYRQATITTWLTRAGEHAQTLHERFFCHLHLPHLQLDELRTRLRCAKEVLWLWLAIDPCTKILPVLQLGPRTQKMAHLLIHSLRQLLAPGCIRGSSSKWTGINVRDVSLRIYVFSPGFTGCFSLMKTEGEKDYSRIVYDKNVSS